MKQSSNEWWNIADVRNLLGGEQRYIVHGRIEGVNWMGSWECWYNEDTRKFHHIDHTAIKEVFDVEWLMPYPEFTWAESQKTVPGEILFSTLRLALLIDQSEMDITWHDEAIEHLTKIQAFTNEALRTQRGDK